MSTARTHLIRLGAVSLASAALLGSVAAAGAAPSSSTAGNSGSSAVPATLGGIKTKANTDITDRVHDLNAAIAKVNAAKGLGSGQSTLVAYLGTDNTPLPQLDQKIQGDATVKQAAQDFSTIFSDYRVYVLVLPASRIDADADRVTRTAVPTLTADSSKAQGLVNPQNQAQLQPLIDDLNAQISAASNATNGLTATVLAFTPAQWNANHDVLSPARSSDQTADAAVQKGRSDVQQIRQVLEGSGTAGAAATGRGLKSSAIRRRSGTTTMSTTSS
jgi:hypothetical protein